MNGKKIPNMNYDLKFGNLFKIINCRASSFGSYFNPKWDTVDKIINIKEGRGDFSISSPIFLHSIQYLMFENESNSKPKIVIVESRNDGIAGVYNSYFEGIENKKNFNGQ